MERFQDCKLKYSEQEVKKLYIYFFSASQFFIIFVSDGKLFAENITTIVY
jgi:hypothetical protein